VRRMDVALKLLRDALKQPLGSGALELHGNARILRLKGFAKLFADRKIHRRIKYHLGFLARRLDQRRSDRHRGWRLRACRRGEQGAYRQRARALQQVAAGKAWFFHRLLLPACYRLSARQRSAGKVSQTSVPFGTAFSVGVTIRKVVPSCASTM